MKQEGEFKQEWVRTVNNFTFKNDGDLHKVKQEIFELKEELSQVRKDKFDLEAQLKDALDLVSSIKIIPPDLNKTLASSCSPW